MSASSSSASMPDGLASQTNISATDYARRCRDLMALYKSLLELGAKTIFDLPRVVVIGGQSSGKSSLVEAVSGIDVPRDSGTCTRCPMVCTMSSDVDAWSCSIAISHEFAADGQPLALPATTPFGPPVIQDKGAVELWIRRAQAAVLSPHRPPADFARMSEAEIRLNARADQARILPFSKNAVQVSVNDPLATDLSFVDLPGLIQNAEADLIAIVRSLVESYVEGKNTLIVIAMPMSDDIEMMQAVVIAADADPDKERTIGVLTKPDTLTKGATGTREKWRAVLEGREHATTHGYYCVRLPDDDERQRKISAAEAQRTAARFFDSTAPWSAMADRTRFGIPNFVRSISALLVARIEKNLPELRKAVADELGRCAAELAALPPRSDADPATEVILRVNAFCKDIADAVHGRSADTRLARHNRARYAQFKDAIVQTTPDFWPFEIQTPLEGVSPYGRHGSLLAHATRTAPRWLDDVRAVIQRSIGWELPGEIPFEATKVLITQYTDLWPAPSGACFDDIGARLLSYLEERVQRHFGQFKYLESYVRSVILEQLQICSADARGILDKLLALESHPLFTQNFDAFSAEKRKWLSKYELARNPIPHRAGEYEYSSAPSPVARASYAGSFVSTDSLHTFPTFIADDDLGATPVTWTIEKELCVMASVQAYFQVAFQRVIDYVPLTIEHELNQTFSGRIDKTLLSSIFKDAAAGKVNIDELLQEDPVIGRKRKDLSDRRARLVQIKSELDRFSSNSDIA
ncbi:hypothetical protein HYPSUDRAFT_42960 [Hypholoma sublateritium FD-334 SS-4]|uniref:GED domain-containing protein n=1 Tax=Hypholoma sublateritium (strain FD-334 SS-4) TaxID=945553 RepID=A0A0D2NVW6_HYPSF|nr:hypothetical protein HYPSUDRAFT_42960 [Hypholoma sublateritium FD-334 SS-4]